jgi:hypothetical protein
MILWTRRYVIQIGCAEKTRPPTQCSLIEDFYTLKAAKVDNGYYAFEDNGVGITALVFVGTGADIVGFLEEHANLGVENRVKATPDIFMGAAPYRPGENFKAVSMTNIAKQLVASIASADQEIRGGAREAIDMLIALKTQTL